MKEVKEFLSKNPVQYLATQGIDGKSKVRPFQFMLEKDDKFYFCTSNQKEVFKEITNNPHVEFCSMGENFSWMRLSGKAVFSKDIDIKKKIQDGNDLVRSIYKTPDNPVFEIFYLDEAEAVIADFSGNPPSTHKL